MDVLNEINKALDCTKSGDLKSAEKIYLSISKETNGSVALPFLGLLYLSQKKYKKSEKIFETANKSLKSKTISEGLALVKYYLNKPKEALKYFQELEGKTKNPEILDRYTHLLLKKEKYIKAMEIAEYYIKLCPLKKEAQCLLIETYIHNGKLKEGYNIATKLIQNYPKYWGSWLWYGLLQEMLFCDDIGAEKSFKNVVKYGEKHQGYYNLAINASRRWDLDKSLYYTKKAFQYNLIKTPTLFSKMTIAMRKRQFKKGIRMYHDYIHQNRFLKKDDPLALLKNIWDGKTHKDKTILIYGDQGIGDLIMFSRYLPFVSKKFKKVKVILRENILSLFRYSFKDYKNIEFYNPKKLKRLPRYDISGIMACLPGYLKQDYNNIPYSDGYMKPKNSLIKKYSEKIDSDKLKVGICWEAGATGWREQLSRTLHISLYESFFKIDNTQFYSFQVNPAMDDYKNYPEIIDMGSDFKNYDDTAGALMNLDILVTVDTSLAHLAGALGVKTFMLLPINTDWRWFNDDKTTNWYDSITIFKQKLNSNWDEVIDNIEIELKKLAKTKSKGE